MYRVVIVFLMLSISPILVHASEKEQGNGTSSDIVIKIGKKKFPTVNWDSKTIVSADINCDSVEDYSILGYDENNAYLMVVYGPLSLSSKQETLAIGLSGQATNYLCGRKADLSLEKLIKPSEEEVGEIKGYQESKICKGLNVDDGMCDSFHFFYDHKDKELSFWRL